MPENQEKIEYISLTEAGAQTGYSQEYLSLRARQGKLKAQKIGRNWATTKEWLNEYLSKVDEYKNNHPNNHQAKRKIVFTKEKKQVISAKPEEIEQVYPASDFSQNVPARIATGGPARSIKLFLQAPKKKPIRKTFAFSFAVLALIFLVGGAVFYFSFSGLQKKTEDILITFAPKIENTASSIGELKNAFNKILVYSVAENVKGLKKEIKVSPASVFDSTRKIVSEALVRIGTAIRKAGNFLTKVFSPIGKTCFNLYQKTLGLAKFIKDKITQGFSGVWRFARGIAEKIAGLFGKKEAPVSVSLPTSKIQTDFGQVPQGLIVVPSEGEEKDAEKKIKIQQMFSDEVEINIKDDSSGIIVPIFKERKGGEYLYMMVPVREDKK